MPTFKKLVIVPDDYVTRDGPASVTPARVRHWHTQCQEMLKAGIRPTMPWGHQPNAFPFEPDSESSRQFATSALNAGYVTDSELDSATGAWTITCDAPAVEADAHGDLVFDCELPGGVKTKGKIGDVSVQALDWVDGKKRVWKDAPIHVALCTLPVAHGLGGFTQLPDSIPGQSFSLSTRVSAAGGQRFAMETPAMADDTKKDAKDAKADAGAGITIPIGDLIEALRARGIELAKGTTDETFVAALASAMLKSGGATTPPPAEPTVATDTGTGAALSMSLATALQNPAVAALVQERDERNRADRLARIADFEGRGLKPTRAKLLREEATSQRFSLGTDGRPASAPIDATLALLDETLPKRAPWAGQVSGATEVVPPEGATEADKATEAKANADRLRRHTQHIPLAAAK